MPNLTEALGNTYTAYVPMVADLLTLGYTAVRFYTASSEDGSYSLAGTATLVAGTYDYSYNDTTGSADAWWRWAPYGATPGEGPRSEPQPVAVPRVTRLTLRRAVGARLQLCDVYTMASVSSPTVGVVSELIDPDASVHDIANRFARCSAGTAIGQTRRVRAGSTGYAVATGAITVNRAFSSEWVQGDTIELWKPRGQVDTSVMVDLAMQDARNRLWWEETFYLTVDSDVTEYVMPALMKPNSIVAVEWAADTYPSRPGWMEVPYFKTYEVGRQLYMSLGYSGRSSFAQGAIIRVRFNRQADRMDSDTDYWEVDREWAEVETAAAFWRMILQGGGDSDAIADARGHYEALREDRERLGRIHMPAPKVTVEPPW